MTRIATADRESARCAYSESSALSMRSAFDFCKTTVPVNDLDQTHAILRFEYICVARNPPDLDSKSNFCTKGPA